MTAALRGRCEDEAVLLEELAATHLPSTASVIKDILNATLSAHLPFFFFPHVLVCLILYTDCRDVFVLFTFVPF